MSLFDDCFAFVVAKEGGFSNDPRDPGGATGAGGVTLRAVRLRDHDKDGRLDFDLDRDGDVDIDDMRLLRADAPQTRQLYREDYWLPTRAEDFGPRLSLALFDCAINSGPRVAVALLQRAIGVSSDGIVGTKTLAAASSRPDTLEVYVAERAVWYARCEVRELSALEIRLFVNSGQVTFLRGWQRRLASVQTTCIEMARK